MRVALCLSGQMRNFEDYYQSLFDKIINVYNTDVFLHTWKVKSSKEEMCLNIFKPKLYLIDYFDYKNVINNNDIILLNEEILNKKNFDNKNRDNKWIPELCGTPENIYGMFYSMNKCNELKKKYEIENNFRYDLVFRTRMDLFFKDDFNFNIEDEIILPENKGFYGDDHFAYGKSDLIDKYQVYNYINMYINDNVALHPETLIKHHLKINNIKNKYIKFNYLIRGIKQI